MSQQIQFRRGTDAERSAVAFNQAEPVFITDKKELYLGDGIATGGIRIGGLFGEEIITFDILSTGNGAVSVEDDFYSFVVPYDFTLKEVRAHSTFDHTFHPHVKDIIKYNIQKNNANLENVVGYGGSGYSFIHLGNMISVDRPTGVRNPYKLFFENDGGFESDGRDGHEFRLDFKNPSGGYAQVTEPAFAGSNLYCEHSGDRIQFYQSGASPYVIGYIRPFTGWFEQEGAPFVGSIGFNNPKYHLGTGLITDSDWRAGDRINIKFLEEGSNLSVSGIKFYFVGDRKQNVPELSFPLYATGSAFRNFFDS